MEKKFYPGKSSEWDFYHDAVICHPNKELQGFPFATNFPVDYAHGQKYEIILFNSHIEDAIVDNSSEELFWRRADGTRVSKAHVVAWRRINKSERCNQIPTDPKAFLTKLQNDSVETTRFIRKSYGEMKLAAHIFESADETLLFYRDSLLVSAVLDDVFPPRHYIIRGVKIYVRPSFTCSGKKALCSIDLRIKLLIEHDRENETIDFGDDPSVYWDCPISSLVIEDAVVDNKNVGLLTNYWSGNDSNSQLLVENYAQFEELRRCIIKGQELLGL